MNYRTWRQLPLPFRLQKLPKDQRGYPVPFIVARDRHGKPLFQINDDRKVERCLSEKLCAICGQQMLPDQMWLVGGPLSALHERGAYIDTPTHKQCLEYAMKVCPYLAVSSYQHRIDLGKVDPADLNFVALMDTTQSEERVPYFIAINVTGYDVIRRDQHSRVLKPHKPYLALVRWHDGEKIDEERAAALQAAKDEELRQRNVADSYDNIPLNNPLGQMNYPNTGTCPFGYGPTESR